MVTRKKIKIGVAAVEDDGIYFAVAMLIGKGFPMYKRKGVPSARRMAIGKSSLRTRSVNISPRRWRTERSVASASACSA